jgi:phosphate transport system permease protein
VLLLAGSGVAVVIGMLCIATTALDWLVLPVICGLVIGVLLQTSAVYGERRRLDPALIVLLGLCLVAAAVLGGLPSYFAAFGMKAIFHHSAVAGPALLVLAVPCACVAVYYLLGGTPRAEDAARFPLLLAPVVLCLASYGVVGWNLIGTGVQQLLQGDRVDGSPGWTVFIHEFVNPNLPPYIMRAGLLNHVLGTALLVILTIGVALPIGVASGVFVAEVAGERLARVVQVSTSTLRGMSVFLLALLAASVVTAARDTPLGQLFDGFYLEADGVVRLLRGSYVTAAIVTALLIIPVIARATELGCRSLPRGIREGSAALGATDDYTLMHLTLPWAVPNILTATLLGGAEAAGSVGTLFFIAGSGENGVGPLSEVTSLAFAVFYTQYSPNKPFRDLHQPYQYAAALALLAIALALTVAALFIKRRYAARYRGA